MKTFITIIIISLVVVLIIAIVRLYIKKKNEIKKVNEFDEEIKFRLAIKELLASNNRCKAIELACHYYHYAPDHAIYAIDIINQNSELLPVDDLKKKVKFWSKVNMFYSIKGYSTAVNYVKEIKNVSRDDAKIITDHILFNEPFIKIS